MTRTTSNNTSVINYWEKSVFLPIPRITVLTWRLHGKAQPPLIQETLKPLLPCVVSGAAAPSDLCSKVTRSMGYTSPVPGQASSRTAATATVWPANCQLLGPRANHVCMYIYIFIIVSTYNYDLLYLYIYISIIYRVYIYIYTWYVTYTLYIYTYIILKYFKIHYTHNHPRSIHLRSEVRIWLVSVSKSFEEVMPPQILSSGQTLYGLPT